MSEELAKLLRRFEERLARLEAGGHEGPVHWKLFHLHKALNALDGDHSVANMHLDEFDREELAREYPELADKPPTIEEIRSRFATFAGGML
jgi:hypothetical protein